MTTDTLHTTGAIRFLPCESRPIPWISMEQLRNSLVKHRFGNILNIQEHRCYYEVTCENGTLYTSNKDWWVAHRNGWDLPYYGDVGIDNALDTAMYYRLPQDTPDTENLFVKYGIPTIKDWLEQNK